MASPLDGAPPFKMGKVGRFHGPVSSLGPADGGLAEEAVVMVADPLEEVGRLLVTLDRSIWPG